MRRSWQSAALVWTMPLVMGLSAAQAQDWAGFEAQSLQCSQTRTASACRAALDRAHLLKSWAEKRQLLRCYTALLGAEAQMIAGNIQTFAELRQVCSP
jgi:hypothetical protein